jgi:hypothetical protein
MGPFGMNTQQEIYQVIEDYRNGILGYLLNYVFEEPKYFYNSLMIDIITDVVWFVSIIVLSMGGTFAIIYVIKHVMGYFERRKYR